jgi:hypothetical protein
VYQPGGSALLDAVRPLNQQHPARSPALGRAAQHSKDSMTVDLAPMTQLAPCGPPDVVGDGLLRHAPARIPIPQLGPEEAPDE